MKILLISPASKKNDTFLDYDFLKKFARVKAISIPLALPTLAALTPGNHDIRIIDENVEEIDFETGADLVGITFFTYLAPRAYEIADKFKARGVKVVLGGVHASMLPEEAGRHADSVVVGEAEELWPRLIGDLQNNELRPIYKQESFPEIKNVIPRWDLVDIKGYSYFSLQVGRGCPHGCEFCSVYIYNGRIYRHKPVDFVIKEIEALRKLDPRKPIFFVDDNILSNLAFAKELFREIIPMGIKWWSQASIDRLQDDDLLSLMKESGCQEVFIGLESVSEQSLIDMGKTKANKLEEYEKTINNIHKHGIAVFGSFMFGSDSDSREIFDDTYEFIQRTNIPFAMLNILGPAPGTVINKRLNDEGRIITRDWRNYDAEHVCFKPKLMSAEELQTGRDNIMRKVYSYESVYKRFKNLWEAGVFVRQGDKKRLYTKTRLLLTIRLILMSPLKPARTWFIIKCFWNRNITAISPILLAMNFNDHANKARKRHDN